MRCTLHTIIEVAVAVTPAVALVHFGSSIFVAFVAGIAAITVAKIVLELI